MPIIFDVSLCTICGQVIKSSDLSFASWWGACERELVKYEDAPLHWHCYAASSVRKRLVQCNFDQNLTHRRESKDGVKAIRGKEPYYLVLINLMQQKVILLSMDIGAPIVIDLENWDETLRQLDPTKLFEWQVAQDVWTEFLPAIKDQFPTKVALLQAINRDFK
jgi:hypothetical protein